MAEFTPGPWRAGRPDMLTVSDIDEAPWSKNVYADDSRGGFHHVTSERLPFTVCRAYGEESEALANARLIASAPELYSAVEWVLRDAAYKAPESIDAQVARRWLERLSAALAKADGGEGPS